jgi:hypothetical protein
LKVEADHGVTDEEHRVSHALSLDAYRIAATRCVAELLTSPEVRMRMFPSDLQAWLERQVFETMHGAGRTSGNPELTARLHVEARVLGVAADAQDADRPRYGYARGSREDSGVINGYGRVLVRFHDHVRDDAKVLLGDSMGSTHIGEFGCIGPEPLGAPELLCRYSSRDVLGVVTLAEACDPYYDYAEVQLYGPLRPEDIKQVVFCDGLAIPVDVQLLLNSLGVASDQIAGFQP